MWFLLCILGGLVPLIIGAAAAVCERLQDKKAEPESFAIGEMWLTGGMVVMGLAEVSHLYCLFMGKALWGSGLNGIVLFVAMTGVVTILCLLLCIGKKQMLKRNVVSPKEKSGSKAVKLFIILLALQILMIIGIPAARGTGDIMAETVSSFLATGRVYEVNPMTGLPFSAGVSGREKVLGLATLYAMLCKAFDTDVLFLLEKIIPIFVLTGSYMAFQELGRALFSGKQGQVRVFLSVIALIYLLCPGLIVPGSGMTAWAFPVAGRDPLNGLAYLGIGIRNMILLPYTLALSLRFMARLSEKKGNCLITVVRILLCLATEVFICQTLYGMGYCLLTVLLVSAGSLLLSKRSGITHLFSEEEETMASEEGGLRS